MEHPLFSDRCVFPLAEQGHHGVIQADCLDIAADALDQARQDLAGANLDSGQPELLLHTISRLFGFLSGEQKQAFAEFVTEQIQ